MNENGVLSADSHVVEPADFWTAHIDERFAARAPRAFVEDDGTVRFVVDGDKALGSVGAPAQAGTRFDNPEVSPSKAPGKPCGRAAAIPCRVWPTWRGTESSVR